MRNGPTAFFLDMSPPKAPPKGSPATFVALEDIAVPESAAALGDGMRWFTGQQYNLATMHPRLVALVPVLLEQRKIEITDWVVEGAAISPPPVVDLAQSKRGSDPRRLLRPKKLWAWIRAKFT